MRASEPFPDDPVGRQVAVAFCSDFNTNEPALRPHGFSWLKPEPLEIASLDHSIWFFGDTDITQWHLHEVGVIHTGGGVGTTMGRIFDTSGRLVATTTQVAMMRSTGSS